MTRKSALRFLAAFVMAVPDALRGQGELLKLSYGRVKPRPKTAERESISENGSWIAHLDEYEPGTATATLHLEGFESFTVTNGNRKVTITRDELWAALGGTR